MKSQIDPETEERALRLLRPFARVDSFDAAPAAAAVGRSRLSWEDFIAAAEPQGMSGLLYYHCRESGVDLPDGVRRTLKGLYARQKRSAQIKTKALTKLVARCLVEGVELFVLKGAALGHIVYPEQGLRPSSDIDLYVAPPQIDRAGQILSDMGFQWHDDGRPIGKAFEEKHLPPATLFVDGDPVRIDLHHHLLKKGRPNAIEGPDPGCRPFDFPVGGDGPRARTLGLEDSLRYLSLHFCDLGHEPVSPVSGNSRLIWAVDIVAFAARFADSIDWKGLARHFPWVFGTLSLLGLLLPLPRSLQSRLPSPGRTMPRGIGRGYLGWPGTPFAGHRGRERARILWETFLPSAWWLRLYYGLGITETVYYHRIFGHPLHICGHVGRLVARRLRSRSRRG